MNPGMEMVQQGIEVYALFSPGPMLICMRLRCIKRHITLMLVWQRQRQCHKIIHVNRLIKVHMFCVIFLENVTCC